MPLVFNIATPLMTPVVWMVVAIVCALRVDTRYVAFASQLCFCNAIGLAVMSIAFGDLHGIRGDQPAPLYAFLFLGMPTIALLTAQLARSARPLRRSA